MTLPYPEHDWRALPTPPRPLGKAFRGAVAIVYKCRKCGLRGTAKKIHDDFSLRCRDPTKCRRCGEGDDWEHGEFQCRRKDPEPRSAAL